ncbi:MAG: hypothetical protein CO133_01530 [Candidatus Komeilibacteria bacterium CG_4_9_14_3_um_filter_37_5]|nr:MAG: hypothetical protein CO133_01530 [Candidatus Komeilibacteria bacterium CG_4_9_14_3_um_filter_37_5]
MQTNPQLVLQAELDFLSRDTDLQLAKEVALILNKSNFSGVFPLLVEGRLIGIVGFTFDRVQLSVTEAKLIQILAQQVARVYQQSMLYNYSLHRLSIWQQGIGENKINL